MLQILTTVFRVSVAACGRRLDNDGFVGIDDGGIAALEPFHVSVFAPGPILADLTGLAAGQAERAHPAVAGENGAIHLLEKTNGAADAVARLPRAVSAGILADVKILE